MRRLYHLTEENPQLIPTLNFHADALTIINPTRRSILIRAGGRDYPPGIEQSDLVIPAVAAVTYPVDGTDFALTFAEPSLEFPAEGMPSSAIVIFTFDENVPNFGAMALATVKADITNDQLNARITEAVEAFITGGTVDTVIQNAVLDVQGDVNAVVTGNVDANITNAEIPVTGDVLATIQNAVLDVQGTVEIGSAVDARITNPELTVNGSVDTLIQNTEAIPISGPVDATIQNASINTEVLNEIQASITNPSLTVTGSVDTLVQNAELQVSGTVDAIIQNASVPVTGDVNANIQNATINTEVVNTATVRAGANDPVVIGSNDSLLQTESNWGWNEQRDLIIRPSQQANGVRIAWNTANTIPALLDLRVRAGNFGEHMELLYSAKFMSSSKPIYIPIPANAGYNDVDIRLVNRETQDYEFYFYEVTGHQPVSAVNIDQAQPFPTHPAQGSSYLSFFDRGSYSNHSPVTRWEYTIPQQGWGIAVLQNAVLLADALNISTSGENAAWIDIYNDTANFVVGYITEQWGQAGRREPLTVTGPILLPAAPEGSTYLLRGWTYNNTGNSVTFMLNANVVEYASFG